MSRPPEQPAADHRGQRESLGAYTLGALAPAERAAVDAHLGSCAECREELARFAGLPGLLNHLSADEAAEGVVPPQLPLEAILRPAAAARRRTRRWLRAWQAVAVLAALALLVVVVPWPGGESPGQVLTAEPADPSLRIDASATVEPREWGMAVTVQADTLPTAAGYRLEAVAHDAHRTPVATWSATDPAPLRLTGSCYLAADELSHLELHGVDGDETDLLATFRG